MVGDCERVIVRNEREGERYQRGQTESDEISRSVYTCERTRARISLTCERVRATLSRTMHSECIREHRKNDLLENNAEILEQKRYENISFIGYTSAQSYVRAHHRRVLIMNMSSVSNSGLFNRLKVRLISR